MGKNTFWNQEEECEIVKFTRMFNEYGMGEELLFPIKLNQSPTGNLETNLATYLINFKEFKKSQVEIKLEINKDGQTDIFDFVPRN